MKRTGEPLADSRGPSERRHMLGSDMPMLYASRLPVREMAGLEASPSPNGNCAGSLAPEAGTLQRLRSAPPEEKMISLPFGVQASRRSPDLQGSQRSRLPFGLQVFGQVEQVNVRVDVTDLAAKRNSAPVRRDRGRKIK